MGNSCLDDGLSNNSGLALSLGFSSSITTTTTTRDPKPKITKPCLEPCLSLGLISSDNHDNKKVDVVGVGVGHVDNYNLYRQASPNSGVSNSFSSGRIVKRERDISSEEIEIERGVSSRVISDEDEDGSVNVRKKLRLTKEQSLLLEESFKQHSTLNPKQKQALARQLNLRPRQVEVWFQNRRARTKLKQTEVDCEFLKKCCETLTDENRRLQKELQELKAMKLAHPFYMHMPAATLTMCPSCERIGGLSTTTNTNDTASKTPFSIAPKTHFYNPFTSPSAAC